MPKFRVGANVTISIHTVVEAATKEEAIAEAADRPMVGLCHQCSGGSPSEEWVTSGELDGEPTEIQAE